MIPLQIFEKHPTADAYRVGGFYSPYALVSTDKRFTEAELAAELHAMENDWRSLQRDGYEFAADIERCETIYRFATLPHFDA